MLKKNSMWDFLKTKTICRDKMVNYRVTASPVAPELRIQEGEVLRDSD